MASMQYATVERSRCVSCGACENICPKGAISVFKGCFALVDTEACVGCGLCVKTCPATCISLEQRKDVA